MFYEYEAGFAGELGNIGIEEEKNRNLLSGRLSVDTSSRGISSTRKRQKRGKKLETFPKLDEFYKRLR